MIQILPTCVISALEANRLLHKGCKAFLAHVIDKSKHEVIIESVSVVCEFFNIFPDDLPSLPPDREIEFEIKLLPDSAPISIPPYRMTPNELKVQL